MALRDPQITVVFGAAVEGLLAGVKEAEHAIASLRRPVDDFVHSLSGIAEATGAMFAFEKISEWVEQVSEAAEKVDILADAFNTSAERMLAFQNALDVLGGGGANLVRVAQMIGRQLETSVNDPLSKQRAAIDTAKISLGELKDALGSPLEEMELLRKAWQDLAGNPQRLEIFRDLVGPRGLTMVLPYLEATTDKLEELQKQLGKTGANMPTADVKNLHDMAEQVHLLDKAFTGLADTIVVYYSEQIKEALKFTKEWVEYIKDNVPTINKLFKDFFAFDDFRKLADVLNKAMSASNEAGAQTNEWLKAKLSEILQLFQPAHLHALGHPLRQDDAGKADLPDVEVTAPGPSSEKGTTAESLRDISGNAKLVADALSGLGLNATQVAGVLANLQRESGFDPTAPGGGLAQWLGSRLEALKAAEGPAWNTIQGQIDFLLKELQGQFSGVLAKLRTAHTAEESSRIFGGGFEIHHGGKGAAFDAEQVKRDELAGHIAGGEGLSSTSIGGTKGASLPDYKGDYEAFAENEKLKIIEAKGNGQAILKIYDEWLAHILQIYAKDGEAAGKSSKQYQSVLRERVHAEQAQAQQAVENANRLLEVQIKSLNAAESEDLKQVEMRQRYGQLTMQEATQREKQIVEIHKKAVDEILQQELANAAGITQIQQKVAAERIQLENATAQKLKDIDDKQQDDFLKNAQTINQTIARDFASNLMQIATGKTTIVQAFAKLGEELGQKMVEKLMEKFLESSLFGAGGAGGLLSGLFGSLFGGAAGSAATGGGGGIFGGIFSKLFSFLIPGAEHGWVVPSAAGGWVVPSFQSGGILSMLHQNEMVLPSDISQGMQSMIRGGGGGGGGTVNIHAWDTQTGAQALMRNSQAVANSFRTGMAAGGTSLRALSRGGGRYP